MARSIYPLSWLMSAMLLSVAAMFYNASNKAFLSMLFKWEKKHSASTAAFPTVMMMMIDPIPLISAAAVSALV